MIPSEFQYFSPATVEEAVGLLQQHGDEAKLIAGGHSLLPAMKLRLAQPGVLVDISKIASLKGIAVNGNVTIGAGTTYRELASSADVRSACGVLAECVAQIGDIQVRNRGTVGGSLAHADPAADLPAVALALGATLTAKGPGGTRTINADDMFVEMLTTALEPTEVVTEVTFPKLGQGEGASYQKLRHPASRYAIVGVAAYVKLDGGNVAAARIAVTGAGPKATRQADAEAAIIGSAGDDAAVAAASEKAGEGMDFLGDIHASEEYRRAMVKVYTRRALTAALERARA
ncbi:MAG TPA: xanthine dehydrogenase family protein subunit M [Roseiflexaceae bacterium]|nr:xanthine dehydrogenase family protein subunit M [Roseiflexaceae bacterium]